MKLVLVVMDAVGHISRLTALPMEVPLGGTSVNHAAVS
jgi:hypothetical protein